MAKGPDPSFSEISKVVMDSRCTWDHISGIQGVIIFNEAKTVHQLHLSDVSSTFLGEMGLDVFLGDC